LATVVHAGLVERTESPAMFYAKCSAVILVVGALGRYWGAPTTIALFGTAGLAALSGVEEW